MTEGWVDSHAHLYMHPDGPQALLDRAAEAGISWVMCPGVDLATSLEARAVAAAHPDRVLWSAGLHPHDATRWPEEREAIADLVSEAAGVGECGLDFYRNLAPREAQIEAFADQIALAAEHGKPLIVHCRDAFSEVYEMLAEAGLGERAVLHCWTGGSRWTRRFAALGVTFSLAGALTYTTAESLRIAARFVPRDRTMLETDTPYLTPEPHRAEPNEPARMLLTARALAEVWGVAISDVAASTTATAQRVFGGPP